MGTGPGRPGKRGKRAGAETGDGQSSATRLLCCKTCDIRDRRKSFFEDGNPPGGGGRALLGRERIDGGSAMRLWPREGGHVYTLYSGMVEDKSWEQCHNGWYHSP